MVKKSFAHAPLHSSLIWMCWMHCWLSVLVMVITYTIVSQIWKHTNDTMCVLIINLLLHSRCHSNTTWCFWPGDYKRQLGRSVWSLLQIHRRGKNHIHNIKIGNIMIMFYYRTLEWSPIEEMNWPGYHHNYCTAVINFNLPKDMLVIKLIMMIVISFHLMVLQVAAIL